MTEIVDLYGHKIELPDPDGLVINVLVLARVKDPDRMKDSRLVISFDGGTDLIIQQGMVKAAETLMEQEWWTVEDEDDNGQE